MSNPLLARNLYQDCIPFIENCIKISSFNHSLRAFALQPFKLYDYQKRYMDFVEDNRFIILKKFRAGGFTNMALFWAVWKCIQNPDYSVYIVTDRDRHALEMHDVWQLAHDNMPVKPILAKMNDHEIKFENGSMIYMGLPGRRGKLLNCIILDEASFIDDMEVHWMALFPCLKADGKCIVQSSLAYGSRGDWFKTTYIKAARKDNRFNIFDNSYLEHPLFSDLEWIKNVKSTLGKKAWAQEIECELRDEDGKLL